MRGIHIITAGWGIILGLSITPASAGQECFVNEDCDDGVFCTLDLCVFGNCTSAHNDNQCNDGLFCNGTETCDAQTDACAPGDPVTCPQGQFCSNTFNRCVQCEINADCDDGLFCNGTETCDEGLCQDGNPVNCSHLNTECTVGVCDEDLNQCVESAPCDDGNLCTDDICNTGVGCSNPQNYQIGVECCNPNTGGTTIIDDGDACTNDFCNAQSGEVTHVVITCNDNDPCTINDVCVNNGAGCGGTDVNTFACNDDGDCPVGTCNQQTAFCECAGCTDNADCNDGIACTIDTCVNSVCSNEPDHAACATGLFCSQQVCDRNNGCILTDFCTSQAGNPCPNPATCNESLDDCGCAIPTVEVTSRYILITPPAGASSVALYVEGECNLASVNCVGQYVDFDDPPNGPAGRLVGAAVYRTPASWGTVHVRASAIRPDTKYYVHTECSPGAVQSAGVLIETWRYGDTNANGTTNFADVSRVVDAFRGLFSPTLTLEQTDITGSNCSPDRIVNFGDVSDTVDAFRGTAFPCSAPCP
jgi:hypothetical protein